MFWNNSKHKTEQRRPLGGQRVGGFTFVAISEHIQIEVAVNELKMDNAFQTVFFFKKRAPTNECPYNGGHGQRRGFQRWASVKDHDADMLGFRNITVILIYTSYSKHIKYWACH